MVSGIGSIGSSQDQESTILTLLRQYGIKPTGNYNTDLAALKAAQSGQVTGTQKSNMQGDHENMKAKFDEEVQTYMSSHPGVSKADAEAVVKAQHQPPAQAQQFETIATGNLWQ